MAKRGRPRKYTERFLRKIAKELFEWLREEDNFYLKGFTFDKPYSFYQLSEWARRSKYFSQALKKAHEIQEYKLVQNATENKFNSTFVIFTLKNIAGWRDQRKEEHKEVDVAEHLKAVANAITKSDTGK